MKTLQQTLLDQFADVNKKKHPDYPGAFDNLTPSNVTQTSFKVESSTQRSYSATLVRENVFSGTLQKWWAQEAFDFTKATINIWQPGALGEASENDVPYFYGTQYSNYRYSDQIYGIYMSLTTVSAKDFEERFVELTGYSIDKSEYVYLPVTPLNSSDLRRATVTVTSPYLKGTINLTVVQPAPDTILRERTGASFADYLTVPDNTPRTVNEYILAGVVDGCKKLDNTFPTLTPADSIIFDQNGSKIGGGGGGDFGYYDSYVGLYSRDKRILVKKYQYKAGITDDGKYLVPIKTVTFAELNDVTEPGIYSISDENFYYKTFLMVPKDTVIKDALALYFKPIKFLPEDYRFSINGNGDFGLPQSPTGYRGSFYMQNALIKEGSVYVRWIGETVPAAK